MTWWSWSLRQRLAVAICGTLAMGIIVFGIVAWNEVRAAAVEAAQTRLEVVTRRIADLLGSNVSTQKAQLANVARDPAIRMLSIGGDGMSRDSAVARVRRADSTSRSIVAIQIWDVAGKVVFTSSPLATRMDDAARRALLGALAPDDSAMVGPLINDADTLRFVTLGPIHMGGPVGRLGGAVATPVGARRLALADRPDRHARAAVVRQRRRRRLE